MKTWMILATAVAMAISAGACSSDPGNAAAPSACSSDSDCKGDRVCSDGACVDQNRPPASECTSDNDCKGDRVCSDGACVAPPSPTGKGGSDGTAGQGGDCAVQCGIGCGDSCTDCMNKSCCSETYACANDDVCVDLWNCVSACKDQACANACGTKYPSVVSKYNAMASCGADSCKAPCSPTTECVQSGDACGGDTPCCFDSLCVDYPGQGPACGYICTSGSQCNSGCCAPLKDKPASVCAPKTFCAT
jgi:hypothetical protein